MGSVYRSGIFRTEVGRFKPNGQIYSIGLLGGELLGRVDQTGKVYPGTMLSTLIGFTLPDGKIYTRSMVSTEVGHITPDGKVFAFGFFSTQIGLVDDASDLLLAGGAALLLLLTDKAKPAG